MTSRRSCSHCGTRNDGAGHNPIEYRDSRGVFLCRSCAHLLSFMEWYRDTGGKRHDPAPSRRRVRRTLGVSGR